jgi:methylated-DNA-[protein]-cysteine S-methyltransferase
MTAVRSFALFDTEIGRCGIAWGDGGIVHVQLPEASEDGTRSRLLSRSAGARETPPPPGVRSAIDAIGALLRGESGDLSGITLDMDGVPPFHRRVYELARTIPPGTTLSYGAIADRLGARGSARAVGQALARNPFAIVVPCHRVVTAAGRPGGFSANGGTATKLKILAMESTEPADTPPVAPAYGFDPVAATGHLAAADPVLGRLIDAVGPFELRLLETQSVFLALAQAIVYQQLNGKAAATIFGRLRTLLPDGGEDAAAEQVLRAPDEELRAAGLSRSKLLSLRDLAQRTANGEIPGLREFHEIDDEEVAARLTKVRGIGPWTAQMFLIFRLGRPDVLPVDDYGVRKGFMIAFGTADMPDRRQLADHGDRWRPYRTVASWYLWRTVELAQEGEYLRLS